MRMSQARTIQVTTRCITVWIAAIATVMAFLPSLAHAGPEQSSGALPQISDLRSISGATPLPAKGQVGHCGTEAPERHWEQDNTLVVNPTDSQNLAVAWIQDWADAIVVAYSHDGGESWDKSIPPTTPCTGGIKNFGEEPGTVSAIDPSLSFGVDGTLYLTSVIPAGLSSAVVVNRSLDGGMTWDPWSNETHILDEAALGEVLDFSDVVADPQRPGIAFASWYGINVVTGTVTNYLSQTTDGGGSWTEPSIVPSGLVPMGARLFILGDGSLLSIGGEHVPQVGAVPGQILSGRSIVTGPTTIVARTLAHPTVAGSSWSAPAVVAVADPKRMVGVDATLGPDGKTVYATWSTTNATKTGFSMMMATSSDGGVNWVSPTPAAQCDGQPLPTGCVGSSIVGLPATGSNEIPMTPGIVVTEDMIAVAFYDHRRDVPATDPPRWTDVWLRSSVDGGETWEERRLAGPFDMTTAPPPPACVPHGVASETGCVTHLPQRGQVGDFNGLVAIPGGLAATFSLAEPLDGANYELETQYTTMEDGSVFPVKNTDIFFTTLVEPSADLGLTMTASPDPTHPGKSLRYTITIGNDGPSAALGVTLTDYLPATVMLASIHSTQGTCQWVAGKEGDTKGGTVACDLGELQSGQTATVTIDVKVTKNGTVTNTAIVNAISPPDPDPANNNATTTTQVGS